MRKPDRKDNRKNKRGGNNTKTLGQREFPQGAAKGKGPQTGEVLQKHDSEREPVNERNST